MRYKHVFSSEMKSSGEGEETCEGADTTTDGTNILAMQIGQSVKRRDGKRLYHGKYRGEITDSPVEKKKGRKVDPLRVLKKKMNCQKGGI